MANSKKKKNSTGSLLAKPLSHFFALKEERKKINETISANKSARLEAEDFQKSLQGMTKEEKIAANKARVAKYHPEPDFSNISPSPQIAKERQKIKHERDMLEKAKKIWHSIVSVPMGGTNKKH